MMIRMCPSCGCLIDIDHHGIEGHSVKASNDGDHCDNEPPEPDLISPVSLLETHVDIDTRLEALEAAEGASVPGTMLNRAQMDARLFAEHGLGEPPAGTESVTVWCLGLGASWEPKEFFYGHTIVEALEKAELLYGVDR